MEKESKIPVVAVRQAINISGDTVTLSTEHLPEEQRKLVRWLFSWCKDNNFSWKAAADESGLSTTTLYRVWQDDYRYPKTDVKAGQRIGLESICEKIARVKELADARSNQRRAPFIETSVYRSIAKLCKEALTQNSIYMLFGESQTGKTTCLREYTRRNNHGNTVYVLVPASAGVQSMMKAIARECHISERTSFEGLRDRVGDFLDSSKLLILDEVHEVFQSYQKTSQMRCLSVLRQLQETSQCGMVLSMTNVGRHEIEQGEFAQALKQLRRRGIWKLQLDDEPPAGDLRLFSDHYGLGEPDGEAKEHIAWIARDWGLGMFCKFLARAAELASAKKEAFGWGHFRKIIGIAHEAQMTTEQKKARRK